MDILEQRQLLGAEGSFLEFLAEPSQCGLGEQEQTTGVHQTVAEDAIRDELNYWPEEVGAQFAPGTMMAQETAEVSLDTNETWSEYTWYKYPLSSLFMAYTMSVGRGRLSLIESTLNSLPNGFIYNVLESALKNNALAIVLEAFSHDFSLAYGKTGSKVGFQAVDIDKHSFLSYTKKVDSLLNNNKIDDGIHNALTSSDNLNGGLGKSVIQGFTQSSDGKSLEALFGTKLKALHDKGYSMNEALEKVNKIVNSLNKSLGKTHKESLNSSWKIVQETALDYDQKFKSLQNYELQLKELSSWKQMAYSGLSSVGARLAQYLEIAGNTGLYAMTVYLEWRALTNIESFLWTSLEVMSVALYDSDDDSEYTTFSDCIKTINLHIDYVDKLEKDEITSFSSIQEMMNKVIEDNPEKDELVAFRDAYFEKHELYLEDIKDHRNHILSLKTAVDSKPETYAIVNQLIEEYGRLNRIHRHYRDQLLSEMDVIQKTMSDLAVLA